mgnify:CR=1 FL=1
MLDAPSKRTAPQTAQVIASPPRRQAKPADPCAMVIFGATGDLTKRLVMPALYNLARTKVLPENFVLIGVARAEGTAESWREQLHDALKSFDGNAGAEFDSDRIDEAAGKRLAEKMAEPAGERSKPALEGKIRGGGGGGEKKQGEKGKASGERAEAGRGRGKPGRAPVMRVAR